MPGSDCLAIRGGGKKLLNRMSSAAAATVFAISLIISISAESGIVMTAGEDSLIRNIYIDGSLLRIDMAGGAPGDEGKLIYRSGGGENVLLIVDKSEFSYYEITPEDMRKIKKHIDDAVEMIKEILRGIPEDRREETEPVIRGLLPPEYSGFLDMMDMEKRVVKEQENVRIRGWLSDRYSVYRNDRKITEAWFAEAEQFGLESNDFKVLKDFDGFLEIPAPGLVPGLLISEVGDDNAVPLRITEIGDDDIRITVLDVEEFSREDIPPAVFSVPEGFTKREIEL